MVAIGYQAEDKLGASDKGDHVIWSHDRRWPGLPGPYNITSLVHITRLFTVQENPGFIVYQS